MLRLNRTQNPEGRAKKNYRGASLLLKVNTPCYAVRLTLNILFRT